jgi:hypothetical protein
LKVASPVGEFPFELRQITLARGRVRIEGAMGAWPAHVELEPADLVSLARALPVPALAGGVAVAALLTARLLRRRS